MGKGKISLVLGAVIGATLGILFAPTKGKEFREKFKKERDAGGTGLNTLKNHAKKVQEEVSDEVIKIADSKRFKEITKQAKEKLIELAGVDEEEFGEIKKDAGEKIDTFKEKAGKKIKEVHKKASQIIKKVKKNI